jgi:hypothetical protein
MGLPEKSIIPDPSPVHDQGDKNSCTAHAYAAGIEIILSGKLKETVTVDANDLWEKQKNFGTATEDEGDTIHGPAIIAAIHGVKFETESGKKGIFYPRESAQSQLIWISR